MTTTKKLAALLMPISVIIALAATIIVNGLANVLPIGGQNTGEISDNFPILITPASYVFSIWGLIYTLLIVFSIYQILPAARSNQKLANVRSVFILSSVFNIGWIYAWHYDLVTLSLGLMLGILASLITIYLRLGIGRQPTSNAERWFLHLPFSIYLGWITVATVVNVSVVLYNLNWQGFGLSNETWAVIAIAAAAGISVLMSLNRKDIAFTSVAVWAFVGIVVAQNGLNAVAITAIIAVVVVILVLVLRLLYPFNTTTERPVKTMLPDPMY